MRPLYGVAHQLTQHGLGLRVAARIAERAPQPLHRTGDIMAIYQILQLGRRLSVLWIARSAHRESTEPRIRGVGRQSVLRR